MYHYTCQVDFIISVRRIDYEIYNENNLLYFINTDFSRCNTTIHFWFIFIFSFRINGNRKSKNAKFIQINRKIVRRI